MDFDVNFDANWGKPVRIAPGIVRVTANNPGPFTFKGTNSYIVGADSLAVIDPGPDDTAHLEAILAAIGGRPVSHILITHTHRDHSPLAERLKAETGAITVAEGIHRPARPLLNGQMSTLDAAGDTGFRPDLLLAHGERIAGEGWSLEAVFTPGHCANHLAFALDNTGVLFSGDHVMAWSTSVVAPPDGAMSDYMASLDLLASRDGIDTLYLPGHGGPVTDPRAFVRALKAHRKMRERAIVERLSTGDRTIPEIVAAIYRDIDPRLYPAAGLSVLAHLQDLAERRAVMVEGSATLDAVYQPV